MRNGVPSGRGSLLYGAQTPKTPSQSSGVKVQQQLSRHAGNGQIPKATYATDGVFRLSGMRHVIACDAGPIRFLRKVHGHSFYL